MLMKKIQEIYPSGFGMRKEGTIIFKYTSTVYITRSCSLRVKIDVFGKISEFKTGWYIYNMNLEHPIVPENKAVLKKKKKITMMRVCQRDIETQLKRLLMAKIGTTQQKNK